jgi:GntR family carbon starvation induced transcriptional regulator
MVSGAWAVYKVGFARKIEILTRAPALEPGWLFMAHTGDPKEAATLAEKVFLRLRHDLKANRFKPNERLRFDRMREIYETGTAPLREALSRLSESGLVVQIGQKGFRAAPATMEDLRHVVETRRFLEVRAAQDSVLHGSEEWEAALVATFHRFAKVSRGKPATAAERAVWEERHTEFHRALIAGCPNRWIRHLWSIVFDQAERYRRSAIEVGHWSESEYDDHKQLLDAAVARDVERLCELLSRHIGVSADRLVAHLGPSLAQPLSAARSTAERRSAGITSP